MRQGQQVRVLADDRGGKADYSVPVIHVPFFNGIMEAQNYFFAKPDRRVVKEALDWADLVHIEDPFPLSGQNRYKAGNVQELTRKIDYWFEHRADLPKVGEDYIALAKTLSIEESARKVIAMMEDTAKAFEK